jgi:enoyl-[acyl-carrier-protein] reductase (NADH)
VALSTTKDALPFATANDAYVASSRPDLCLITKFNSMGGPLKDGIRVNAVAPGVVDTPLHKNDSQDVLKSLSPMGRISGVQDIADAVLYLTEARLVTGEVLHVDGGAHLGKW